jgi:hypothetical protein
LIQSPPLLATILLASNRPKHAILVLLGSALQFIGVINPFYLPVILIPVVVIASLRQCTPNNNSIRIAGALLIAINILPTLLPQKSPLAQQSLAYPYRIDVAKYSEFSSEGTTYASIDDHGEPDSAQIMVLEHDPPHGLATHNWSQSRLWTENQYFGAPLLRIATGLDGFLYSNLGCRVDGSRFRLLGEGHRTEHNSLVSKKSGQLVFSDSDFLINCAIGYQKNLIEALFERFSLAQAILLGTAFSCALSFWKCTKSFGIPIASVVALAACIAIYKQPVDIRICSSNAPWPHSKGVGGIGSEIEQESGIKTVSRYGKAQILAIARGSSATRRTEKVIVMEGNTSVIIGSTTYEAIDLPQGEVDGIIDAIPIRKQGSSETGKCIQKSGNVTLIGTNSARSNSKTIHAAAE